MEKTSGDTTSSPPASAFGHQAGSSCGLCGKINQCRTCRDNDWKHAHSCPWCSRLNGDQGGHEVAGIGIFCGEAGDSICYHLYMELIDRTADPYGKAWR